MPERCLEAYHLHRTRLELIAEKKVRRRQLTDDGMSRSPGQSERKRGPTGITLDRLSPGVLGAEVDGRFEYG